MRATIRPAVAEDADVIHTIEAEADRLLIESLFQRALVQTESSLRLDRYGRRVQMTVEL